MHRRLTIVGLELLAVIAGLSLLAWTDLGGTTALATEPVAPFASRPNGQDQATATLSCRYALSAWEPELSVADPEQWGLGWYLNFGALGQPVGDMEYMRVVHTRQDKYWNGSAWVYSDTFTIKPSLSDTPGGLGPAVTAHPGSWWVIGNEPDRGPNPNWSWWPGQDGIYPQLYAQAYYSVYHFIRERDPNARIGPGGLVQVTPSRLQYLDLVWQAYQDRYGTPMPLDFWTMHIYILPEADPNGNPNTAAHIALGTDPALAYRESGNISTTCHNPANDVYCWADHDDMVLFDEQARRMRQWMKDHDMQDRPLWLNEWSILLYPDFHDEFGDPFTATRVIRWLTSTHDYMRTVTDADIGNPYDGYRLIQGGAWYSLYTSGTGYGSNLLTYTPELTLTAAGRAYRDYLLTHPAELNLQALYARPDARLPGPGGTTTVTIGLRVANNGDAGLSAPVTVTWYADPTHTTPIATQTITTMAGCGTDLLLQDTWTVVGTGIHYYWAVIDPDDRLAEVNEQDNEAMGVILIASERIFLPLVLRRSP